MQYLTLPFKNNRASAGYKSEYYKKQWGFGHYGIDLYSAYASELEIFASGEGTVKAAGIDGLNGKLTGTGSGCGKVVVIEYDNCYNWKTKKTENIVATYMHLATINVKAGQKLKAGDLIGVEGSTGANSTGRHLHLQMDTDTKNFIYCSGLSAKGHALLKKGTVDSTENPCHLLHIGKGQGLKAIASPWYDSEDFTSIPKAPTKTFNYTVCDGPTVLKAFGNDKAAAEAWLKSLKVMEK